VSLIVNWTPPAGWASGCRDDPADDAAVVTVIRRLLHALDERVDRGAAAAHASHLDRSGRRRRDCTFGRRTQMFGLTLTKSTR
jgi:hypothetical protein